MLAAALGAALLTALVLHVTGTASGATLRIRSGSMMPTVMVDDQVRLEVDAYDLAAPSDPGRLPARGDVIAFDSVDGSGHILVKRVVGLPGDHVEVRGDRVVLNGEALDRQGLDQAEVQTLTDRYARANLPTPAAGAVAWEILGPNRYQIRTGTIEDPAGSPAVSGVVPAGHLYVVGDNRPGSVDSRHGGPISLERVRGQVTTDPTRSVWMGPPLRSPA